MAKRKILTAARLRELLYYDPDTGDFSWVKRSGSRWRDRVGNTSQQRHIIVRIGIDYRQYKGHQLAWLWMTGDWPTLEIDHINQDPTDNRWSNLRLATRSQNGRNHKLYKTNTSGVNGVIWDKWTGSWIVSLYGKHIGRYSTKDEATQIALFLKRKG
jgi:hypothetical protein